MENDNVILEVHYELEDIIRWGGGDYVVEQI